MKNSLYVVVLSLTLLTGCASNPLPPVNTFTLSAMPNTRHSVEKNKKTNTLIIKIAAIHALRAFNSTDLLYTDKQYILNSYAYSRWNDTPGNLLQPLIQIALQESHLFKAVIPSTSVSKSDLLLESSLIDFSHHINKDGTSEVIFRIHFYLININTRTVTASKEFVSTVPALNNNAEGAVLALNKSVNNITHSLVTWLSQTGRL